jgi:uncharacterized protein with beta-barrel porin domain
MAITRQVLGTQKSQVECGLNGWKSIHRGSVSWRAVFVAAAAVVISIDIGTPGISYAGSTPTTVSVTPGVNTLYLDGTGSASSNSPSDGTYFDVSDATINANISPAATNMPAVSVGNTGGYDGTLINNGSINAQGYSITGLKLVKDANIALTATGSVVNNGSITADIFVDYGMGIHADGHVNGSITNAASGVITVRADTSRSDITSIASLYGIYTFGDVGASGSISNAGTINVQVLDEQFSSSAALTGDYYAGIYVTGVARGSVSNQGTIDITLEAASAVTIMGIYVLSVQGGGNISNSGTIDIDLKPVDFTSFGTVVAGGIWIEGAVEGTVTNTATGSINVAISPNPSYDFIDGTTLGAGSTVSLLGIYAGSVAATGSIINNGSIDLDLAGYWGYYVNSGTTAGGIAVGSVAGDVINNGSIDFTVTGYGLTQSTWSAHGIHLGGIQAGGEVTNSTTGTINVAMTASASGSNSVAGIYAYDNLGTITNDGTITVAANQLVPQPIETSAGFSTAGAGAIVAYGVYVNGIAGTIDNSGSITVSNTNANNGESAIAYGIFADGIGASGSVTVTAGTIDVTASANHSSGTTGAYAYGLYLDGDVSLGATFSNAGTISAHGENVIGGPGTAAGVLVDGALAANFVNSGTVQADWNAALASNAYSIVVGEVADVSSVQIRPTDIIPAGIVDNRAGGLLKGNLYLGNGVGLENAGTVWLPEKATGTKAAYVSGNFTNLADGILKVEVYGKDPADHSQLVVDGAVALDGQIYVNVRNGGPLAVGDRVEDVILTNTGITGNFATVSDNSSLFNFTSVIDGNTVDLDVSKGTTVYESAKARKFRPAYGAAKVLDEIAFGDDAGGMQDVIDALATIETESEVAEAAYQTLPLLTAGAPRLARDVVSVTSTSVDDRMNGLSGQISNVEEVSRNVWIDPIGAWTKQDEFDKSSGYDASLYGVVAGMDGEVSPAYSMGGAFAYVNSSADSVSGIIDHSATVESYQAILYGLYSMENGTLLRYQLDGGVHNTDGRRHMNFGYGDDAINRMAKSDYASTSFHAAASLERTYALSNTTALVPRLKADLVSVWSESYDETGAGSLNLSVEDQQYKALVFSMDARLEHKLSETVRFDVSGGVGYDMVNERSQLTAAYEGAPDLSFDVDGMQTEAWIAQAGAGFSFAPSDDLRLSAGYNAILRDGLMINMVGLEANWRF